MWLGLNARNVSSKRPGTTGHCLAGRAEPPGPGVMSEPNASIWAQWERRVLLAPLSGRWFANMFSHSVGCFHVALWIVSFDAQKFFTLMKPDLSTFAFVACAFGVVSSESLLTPVSGSFCPTFSYEFYSFSS